MRISYRKTNTIIGVLHTKCKKTSLLVYDIHCLWRGVKGNRQVTIAFLFISSL